MSGRGSTSRVYIGNLPEDISQRELEDLFYKFGRIKDIDIKYGRTSNGTAYAFLEFEDPRDAEEAVDRRDGYRFAGVGLRVEFTGERRPKKNRNRSHGPIRRTLHRVSVIGLPSSASWQDLKDHMRQAGPVGYANIEGSRGIVEYETREDKDRAVRKLDGSEFKNIFHRCVIRVRSSSQHRSISASSGSPGRKHSRSRSRSYSRSVYSARGKYRGDGYSRSRSRSGASSKRERSVERSRSWSHSGSRSAASVRSAYSKHSDRSPSERSHHSQHSYHSHESVLSKASVHSHGSERQGEENHVVENKEVEHEVKVNGEEVNDEAIANGDAQPNGVEPHHDE